MIESLSIAVHAFVSRVSMSFSVDIGLLGRMFDNGPRDVGSISGRVIPKSLKMVLDTSLLSTQHY